MLGEHPALHFSVVDPVEAADFRATDLNGLQVDALRAKRRVAALETQKRRVDTANVVGGEGREEEADRVTTIRSTVEGWLMTQKQEAAESEETAANAEADRLAAEGRADHALEQVKLLERQRDELERRMQEAREAKPPRLTEAKETGEQIDALDQTISQHEAQYTAATSEARAIFSGIRPCIMQQDLRTAGELDDYSRQQADLHEKIQAIKMLRDKEVRLEPAIGRSIRSMLQPSLRLPPPPSAFPGPLGRR